MGQEVCKIPDRAVLKFPAYNNETELLRQKEEIRNAVEIIVCLTKAILSKSVAIALPKLVPAMPYASKAIEFLLREYSLESALLTYNIKQEVMKSVVDCINCKLGTVKTSLDLIFRGNISIKEMETEVKNAERDCREILENFKENRTLNEWPVPCAPVLVNFGQTYIDVAILYHSLSPSSGMKTFLRQTISVDLCKVVRDYKRRCVEQRLMAVVISRHLSGSPRDPCPVLHGRDEFNDGFKINMADWSLSVGKFEKPEEEAKVYKEKVGKAYEDYFDAVLDSIDNYGKMFEN